MKSNVHVAIVGAGPAGLITARELQNEDIDFTLFERDATPGKTKVCGGFLPQKAVEEFCINKIRDSKEIGVIRIKFPGYDMQKVSFDTQVGLNASRENIGKALLDSIASGGGEILLETRVNSITDVGLKFKVNYTTKEQSESLEADLIIDSSGVNPITGRFLPVRARISNQGMGYAIQYHLQGDVHGLDANDFYYGREYSPGGYAWVFPRNNKVVVGTGGLISRIRNDTSRITDYLDYLISRGEPSRFDLEGLRVVKSEAALMPLAGVVKPSYSHKILLVGDAAGHCSPISGEGIHYAMKAGQLAGHTVAEAVDRNDFTESILSKYERRWTKSFGSDLKWGLWLQKRILKDGSQSLGSSFLKSRKTVRIIAEMLVGQRSVKSAIIKAVPGYLSSKVRR